MEQKCNSRARRDAAKTRNVDEDASGSLNLVICVPKPGVEPVKGVHARRGDILRMCAAALLVVAGWTIFMQLHKHYSFFYKDCDL
ncbi:unnamed protein product [Dibothriocephalus latus]|uniref:Uncharacterized protein n=1 Tax=Dibothriocephalus latus TaxID=60516 RepID=A0A3P6PJ91_DIBLA|nr:unnamed protein product [Dibothriocephalus latus]